VKYAAFGASVATEYKDFSILFYIVVLPLNVSFQQQAAMLLDISLLQQPLQLFYLHVLLLKVFVLQQLVLP
jgi:hypothetical protein